MKTIFKKIGLSLAAFVCALSAGVGVALTVPQTTEANAATVTLEDRNYYISGTGVRLVNDKNGAGLRFHTNLLASEYAKVEESGTLIIPEFRYDGELTLDDLNKDAKNRPTHIVTKGTVNGQEVNYWKDHTVDGEAFKRATVYLHDIPEVGYGTRMVVVSYVKIDGQYVYTSVIDGSNYISLSSVASTLMNSASAEDKARLDAFIVDDVTITFVMPDGSKTTQTVAYGSKLTAPTLNLDEQWYNFNGWTDQYGNVWDFEKNIASYPVTLTPSLELTEWKQIATKALKDGYNDLNEPKRAWVNGDTPDVLTTGVPAGFNVLNRFTWYKESTSMWTAGGNPFYRNAYDQTDISVYKAVRFGLKVETAGDAYIKLANGTKSTNEWLTFELIQTSANVWTLNVYGENGAVVYSKEGVTKSISGLQDRNSIASLIFCSDTNNANLFPASTTEHDVYVYTTDIIGLRDDQTPVHPSVNTTVVWEHVWNNYYFEGGGSPEGAWSDMEAPSGFTKVTEYSWVRTYNSSNGKYSGDFPKTGHLNNTTTISNYSDLYFAMKVENGKGFYIQGGATCTTDDWLYVHLYQTEDGVWAKDYISADGYTCFGVQKGLTGTNLAALMNWVSGVNTGSYPLADATQDTTATAYFTEVRGILKDGGEEAPEEETTIIPENATVIRGSVWRDDKYALSSSTTVTAPAGYKNVVEFNWADNPSNWTENTINLPTTCISTNDLSGYSDVYFAIKSVGEGATGYYTRNGWVTAAGEDWLYVHYSRAGDGTWTMSLRSEDGSYVKESFRTGITGNNLQTMMNYTGSNNAFYPTRKTTYWQHKNTKEIVYVQPTTDTSNWTACSDLETKVYFTEVYGVSNEAYGERAVWSTVDKAVIEKDFTIGIPAGFTNLYKKENFVMSDFATLDLSNGYYDQIKFALIADQDLILKSTYNYTVAGESGPRKTTVLNSKLSGWSYKLNIFTLTNLGNDSWTLTVEGRLWYSKQMETGENASGSGQKEGTFTYTVSGSSLEEIMTNFMSHSGNTTTVYCTEVRGTHTCKASSYSYAGEGMHVPCCACGKVMGDAVECTATWELGKYACKDCGKVIETAVVVDNHILYDDGVTSMITLNSDLNGETAPEGFSSITRYDNGTGWTSSALNGWYLARESLKYYSEVWFAVKVVNGYINTITKGSTSGSWAYFHLTQTEPSVWTVEITVNGKVFANVAGQQSAPMGNYTNESMLGLILYDEGWASKDKDGEAFMFYMNSGATTTSIYSTEVLGVPYEYTPNIPASAETIIPNVWATTTNALSPSTTMKAPEGFDNVVEYVWNGNPVTYGNQTNFNMGVFSTADVSAYSDIYFATKMVGGSHYYIRGKGSSDWYKLDGWLYVHYQQVDTANNKWTLSLRSDDGWERKNIVTVSGKTLKELLAYGTVNGTNNGFYPVRAAGDQDATVYFTDVRGVALNHEHAVASYAANGNGTHNVLCSCGDTLEVANCYGGTATCSLPSICAACNTAYGAKAEHEGEWINSQYVCGNCGVALGNIQTELDKQTVALFTNATAIAANKTTTATIDLTGVTSLPMSLKSVELDSVTYDATMVGTKVNLTVLPKTCFGEYLATVTVLIDGQEFEISVPVLVVTNLITTNAGMQAMRVVLRGADTEADENGSIGGKGGVDTMQGDGYYMLGGNITLTKGTYVYGTSYVPFVGTFDGNGYSVSGYGWADWHNSSNQQDSSKTFYAGYLEGSLFGVVDGHVKNVAFTNCKFGIYENIMHSGNGLFEDCYIEVIDMNSNANMYTPCIFSRQEVYGTGTLRNCVIDYSNFNSPILDAAINTAEIDDLTPTSTNAENVGTRYMSAAGKIYNGENVLVVNFNKKYISVKSGRGNIYTDRAGNHTDGAEAGIRAEYTDGTNNGAWYSYASLNSKLWKMVNGIPYLIKMNVSGTASAPSATSPEQNKNELDGYVTNNGTTQYYIAWESSTGALKAAKFINDTMKTSTGATLATGAIDGDNLWKKQIVLGTFANYGDKISGLDMSTLVDDSYGIYLVEKTFFILSDSDEAMVIAAEEFCRRIFGWTEIAPNQFIYDMEATVAIPAKLNYTSEIVFDVRSAAFSNVSAEKTTMNFSMQSPYTSYKDMHNALDYFANYTGDMTNMLNVNSEMDEKGSGTEIHGEQLCYTARGNKTSFDAMVGQVVNEIVNLAMEKPSMTAVNFMIEDDPDYCGCGECKKFSNPSIPQLIFLNELAYRLNSHEYMRTAGRTIAIEFFAYSSFYHAPIMTANDITALNSLKSTLGLKATNALGTFTYKDMNTAGATYAAANDNTTTHTILKSDGLLRLYWTSHKASHSYALTHEANDHMYLPLLAWTACVGAQNIDVFMYQTSFWDLQLPLNTWEYQLIWYQELNKLGIGSHMFNLGNSYNKVEAQTAFSAFKAYIDSRAMTDLNVTFEQLKDEFFSENGYYGKAGPQMRVFFEELVVAMESKKQDGDNSILSDNGDTTTEYVDASEFRYYGLDANGEPVKSGSTTTVVKPATPYYWRIQAFFNGVYGLSEGSLLFKQKDGEHNTVTGVGKNTSVTIALEKAAHAYELYMYGGKSQIETLKAWQQYCVTALTTEGLTETQKKHIKAEAVFPEYAMLLLYTDYSVTFTRTSDKADTWTKKDGVTCTLQEAAKNVTSVSGATLTYQSLYNLMKNELGIETPSEQYGYNGVNKSGNTQTIGAGWMNMTFSDTDAGFMGWGSKDVTVGITLSNVLSHSAFKNWGVTL